MPSTFAYTFTKARLELIVDEYEALLLRSGAHAETAERIAEAIQQRMCTAVALRAGSMVDDEFVMVREVRLSIDWQQHDEAMRRGEDTVSLDAKVWEGGVSPETRIAVRRFREAVTSEGLDWYIGVALHPDFASGAGFEQASRVLNLSPPRSARWKGAAESHESTLDEVSELTYKFSVVPDSA